MVHHVAVNDVVWYSRFAVLVGALVLLVQAVTGRAAGFVTLIGVMLLCAGFLILVAALALQGMGMTRVPRVLGLEDPGPPPTPQEQTSTDEVSEGVE